MADVWDWNFLHKRATLQAELEKQLSDETLLYLREHYAINPSPSIDELRAMTRELKNETVYCLIDIDAWFCNRRFADIAAERHRREAKKVAA